MLSVIIRLPGITRPLVGHFATKSATYAMIARNGALGRAPLWRPTTDCMAGGERGWHLLEVPVAAYFAGAGWVVCGGSLDVWGRLTSVAFSAASVVFMFCLMARRHTHRAAYAAALTLAVSPVSIIFGQSFMLEPSVICFMLLTLWSFDAWSERPTENSLRWRSKVPVDQRSHMQMRRGMLMVATISFALLVLTKIYMVVLLLPLAVMASRQPWPRRVLSLGLLVAASFPAVVWCAVALHQANPANPHSAYVFDSLYRSTRVHGWPHPLLLSGKFYARIVYHLALHGLTPLGAALALIGLINRAGRVYLPWLAAMALLIVALPAKFYELQYYTCLVVPSLAALAGVGWECLAQRWRLPTAALALSIVAWLGMAMRLAMGPAFETPSEDRAVADAGAAVQALASPDEPVATLHGASSDLLYYCDRPGWALSTNDADLSRKLEQCRRGGARWLVVADLRSAAHGPCATELAALPVVCEGDDYRVYRLGLNPGFLSAGAK